MGKRIRKTKIGQSYMKKTGQWKIAPVRLPNDLDNEQIGVVRDIVHERGRSAGLAKIEFLRTEEQREDAAYSRKKQPTKCYLVPAVEGIYEGMEMKANTRRMERGNIMKVEDVNLGSFISCVERVPGDCGTVARSAGSRSVLHGYNSIKKEAIVRMPSGQKMTISGDCKCIVGVVSGAGLKEKPFLTAGRKHYYVKARQLFAWPRVSCVAMNPVDHKFGGGNHQHIGRPSTVRRSAPPSRKVGLNSAARTGRKQKTEIKNAKKIINHTRVTIR